VTNEDTNERSEAYFADDDLFTEYESQKQDSGEGLYDGNDELYSASALEKNPPVLRVGKKENDEIQFFSMRVNKEIADSLLFHMKAVDGAYRGVDVRHTEKPFSGEWFSRVASDAIDKIQEHPILSIFVGIILLFCLYSILTNQ